MKTRSILFALVGAAGAAAVLARTPGTADWLRRTLGSGGDRHHYETDTVEDVAVPDEAEAPSSTADLRLSLRARLAESANAERLDQVSTANAEAAAETAVIDRTEDDPVESARARVRAKARDARARLTDSHDPASSHDPATGDGDGAA